MSTSPLPAGGENRMRSRLLLEWLLVGLVSLTAIWAFTRTDLSARADNLVYDALLGLRTHAPSDDIVIVAIDEASLARIGRWPWPRDVHAALLRKLAKAKPRAIGYDVLFVEPSAIDRDLARAVKDAGQVVLPMAFLVPGSNGAAFDPELPVAALRTATRIGHAAIAADADGIVRRIGLEAGGGARVWPHLAETLYRVVKGTRSPAFAGVARTPLPADRFSIGDTILIPFAGPAGSYRTISFGAVLRGEVPPELFTGKIVLVGSTASGLYDQYALPSGTMPGVEVIANTLDDLLSGRGIAIASPRAALAFALVPLLLLLIAFLLLPPRINLLLGLLLIALTVLTSALLLGAGLWLPPAAGLLGLIIVYPLWAWRRLEAASAYMTRELKQLGAEPDALPGREPATLPARFPYEAIEQQTTLLHNAIVRVRDLRRFFADSVQGLPDPTLILDHDAAVVLANREAEALFQPLLDGGGAPALATLLAHLSPDDTATGDAQDREIRSGDGRIFVFRLVPLLAAEGERVGSIARLTDISTIRLAVRQREEALELLTHDMRSPQASILALLEQPGADAETVKDRIGGYARRTLELAENFVQLARAEARRFSEELLDLSSLLMDAIDDQWVLASKAGIRLVSSGEDEEHLVLGDRSLLTRALVNVIGNALKYSEGGTTVRCALSVQAREPGGPPMILCRISDEGRGIPDDQLDTLFERYQRLASAGRRDAGGAGLGLSFVRTVVTRHGGIIEASSPPGEGATFWIWLPEAREE